MPIVNDPEVRAVKAVAIHPTPAVVPDQMPQESPVEVLDLANLEVARDNRPPRRTAPKVERHNVVALNVLARMHLVTRDQEVVLRHPEIALAQMPPAKVDLLPLVVRKNANALSYRTLTPMTNPQRRIK